MKHFLRHSFDQGCTRIEFIMLKLHMGRNLLLVSKKNVHTGALGMAATNTSSIPYYNFIHDWYMTKKVFKNSQPRLRILTKCQLTITSIYCQLKRFWIFLSWYTRIYEAKLIFFLKLKGESISGCCLNCELLFISL